MPPTAWRGAAARLVAGEGLIRVSASPREPGPPGRAANAASAGGCLLPRGACGPANDAAWRPPGLPWRHGHTLLTGQQR
jgi:hypothetical protein